jgi:hypothetical protein
MKTFEELQAILGEQIDRMVAQETTPASVNAVVNATAAILRGYKLQMDYHRQIGRPPTIPFLLTEEVQGKAK